MIIKGTLYYKDEPQLELAVDSRKGIYQYKPLKSRPILPYELKVRGVNKDSLNLFLEERVMPETRQSMRSVLRWAKMPFYDKELIANKNYYSSCNDNFWIKPEGEAVTWNQINGSTKRRKG